jgi:hypothetical protein
LNGAFDVDGRVVDRADASAAPLGETFHSDNYAPHQGRRGQGRLNFFSFVCVRLDRPHLIFEMTEEGQLMGHEGLTVRYVDHHPTDLESIRSVRLATPEPQMTARRWYAEDLKLQAPVRRNIAIVEAFAAVARERFLGPGPWRILPDRPHRENFLTPDDDPRWIYHDVLVAIDPERELNNGLPSFWARNFDHLDLKPDQRVMQVGAGYPDGALAVFHGPPPYRALQRAGQGDIRGPDLRKRDTVLAAVKAWPVQDRACGKRSATAILDCGCARRHWANAGRDEETALRSNKETDPQEARANRSSQPLGPTPSRGVHRFQTGTVNPNQEADN